MFRQCTGRGERQIAAGHGKRGRPQAQSSAAVTLQYTQFLVVCDDQWLVLCIDYLLKKWAESKVMDGEVGTYLAHQLYFVMVFEIQTVQTNAKERSQAFHSLPRPRNSSRLSPEQIPGLVSELQRRCVECASTLTQYNKCCAWLGSWQV